MSTKQLRSASARKKQQLKLDLCRLCLTKCGDGDLTNIFDTTTDTTVSSRILLCTGLEISDNDNLPKKCCYECRYQLEKAFLFRNKCKNSDAKLRRHFWLINSGKESNILDDSEDEYEEQYAESHSIIAELTKGRPSRSKRSPNFRKALNASGSSERQHQDDLENMYVEERQSIDGSFNSNKKEPKKADPIIMSYNDDYADADFNDISQMDDDTDMNPIEPTELFILENEHELQDVKFEQASPEQQNYMVLDSGEVALSDGVEYYPTEMLSEDDFQTEDSQNEEYLEDDYEEDTPEQYERLLPIVKKTIASRADLQLEGEIKYKFTRKTGKTIEVQCTTADGKIICVEMEDNKSVVDKKVHVDANGEFKIFRCDQCPASFSRRQKLLSHASTHKEKLRGQKCSYCSKWFPSNSTLTRHERIHTGEKPFRCNVCGRSFIQKEILKRHSMIHSGERPNKCPHCDKTFILKETMRQHINRQHTENPVISVHKCMICPKTFCHSSGLSRHLLVHAGRTFDCDLCSKKFNDRSALKRHVGTIHKPSN